MAELKTRDVENFMGRPLGAHRVFLVYGPDRGLVRERATFLAAKTKISLDDPFSSARLDGEALDSDPNLLADEALQISMMGGDRLVWVRQTPTSAKFITALTALLKGDLSSCYIILEAAELNKSSSLRTSIEKSSFGITLPCYADEARSLDDLIDSVLKTDNLRIDNDARRTLKSLLGSDRAASRAEVEKLALYSLGHEKISIDDVWQAVGDASASALDRVIDAMLSGDLTSFDKAFDKILSSKLPANVVLTIAIRQFDALQRLQGQMAQKEISASQAVAQARPPIFFTRRKMIENILASSDIGYASKALDRLEYCQRQSRKSFHLELALTRHALMAITVETKQKLNRRFVPG